MSLKYWLLINYIVRDNCHYSKSGHTNRIASLNYHQLCVVACTAQPRNLCAKFNADPRFRCFDRSLTVPLPEELARTWHTLRDQRIIKLRTAEQLSVQHIARRLSQEQLSVSIATVAKVIRQGELLCGSSGALPARCIISCARRPPLRPTAGCSSSGTDRLTLASQACSCSHRCWRN